MKDHRYYFKHVYRTEDSNQVGVLNSTEDIHNFIKLTKFEDEYWVFF